MKKISFLISAILLPVSSQAQTIINVEPVYPLTYEQQGGRLKVLSGIVLSANRDVSFALDGETLPFNRTDRPDSVTAWLPMVGQHNILECIVNDKVTSSLSVEAPINGDWGYFRNGEIHLLQASHQDIAWMDTPEYCRKDRIENIVIPALDMMNTDSDFTFEMEQTLNLMEFLEACPERKDEVIQRFQEGRFLWGATYNQPYEGLASGEQLVRQAYYGRKWIRENLPGCDDFTASNMDVPGRALQMPQILSKSGIKNLFISRHAEGLYDWFSPDGTSVLTYSLGHYGWEKFVWHFLDSGVINAFRKVHERIGLWDTYYSARHLSPCYAVLMSNDAATPDSYTGLINEWNDIVSKSEVPLPRMKYSTTDAYLEEVVTPESDIPDIYGERPDLWLYIHGPAHYEQTLDKRRASVLLPAAEFYSTVNYLSRKDYPKAELDRGWMASIYPDHGLGGKHGDITDAIFADSLATGRTIGQTVLQRQLESLTATVTGVKGDIVIYNDLPWTRTSLVEVPVSESVPHTVSDCNNHTVPSETFPRNDSTFVRFAAEVPAFGYMRFRAVPGRIADKPSDEEVRLGDNWCSNAYYDVVLGDGGIVRLYDKQLGKNVIEHEKFALGDILDAEYRGNGAGEFLRITDIEVPFDGMERAGAHKSDWKVVSSGKFSSTFENTYHDKFADIIQQITVHHSRKKIDFDIRIENFTGEHNRQYRILFPLDMKTDSSDICYEVPMAVSHVGRDELKMRPGGYTGQGSYRFHPADSHPREVLNFISANGNGFGFTMSSCVAVCDWEDPSHEVADYPVLQGILLSSHKSCHGEGNWYHQAGTHDFHFSITTHPEGWKKGCATALEENHPLYVTFKKNKGGSSPSTDSFLEISDHFVWVSTMKKADNEDAVILRLVEMEGADKDITVNLPFTARKVVRCNLVEEELEDANRVGGVNDANGGRHPLDRSENGISPRGDCISLHIGHHSIETFKIY
ncbi:MAG: glycosyl hydrolase-related protein [Bacteroidales bacterium]|nr:glycosyl hydrolase-related protein [Bacteroidales bacterium]